MYDRSLIVVAADHGELPSGRRPPARDEQQPRGHHEHSLCLWKQPARGSPWGRLEARARCRHPAHDRRRARDQAPWEVDGVSLLGRVPERDIAIEVREGDVEHSSPAEMIRNRDGDASNKADEFGEGRDSLFRIGTNKALLGREVGSVDEAVAHHRNRGRRRSGARGRVAGIGIHPGSHLGSRRRRPPRRGRRARDRGQRACPRAHDLVLGRQGRCTALPLAGPAGALLCWRQQGRRVPGFGERGEHVSLVSIGSSSGKNEETESLVAAVEVEDVRRHRHGLVPDDVPEAERRLRRPCSSAEDDVRLESEPRR